MNERRTKSMRFATQKHVSPFPSPLLSVTTSLPPSTFRGLSDYLDSHTNAITALMSREPMIGREGDVIIGGIVEAEVES